MVSVNEKPKRCVSLNEESQNACTGFSIFYSGREARPGTHSRIFSDLADQNARRFCDFAIQNADPAPILFSGDSEHDSARSGILQGDKSDSLLYGSVDNGKKISWNEDFHAKVSEAAKRLHLKEHSVLDGSGNVFKLAAPVECKGIVGGDDR
ncbi:protein KIAA0669 [Trifolium pratense]|uniref:Protein KIAA0669 n=1 Tax=Trifolium pratense TaxID=57577 RepID=A0A2K3MPG6_TRIPR|nr:protein KIAA0669 [Trifolium pratense]